MRSPRSALACFRLMFVPGLLWGRSTPEKPVPTQQGNRAVWQKQGFPTGRLNLYGHANV